MDLFASLFNRVNHGFRISGADAAYVSARLQPSSNHFHVVLRNRPDIVALWSDQEVAYRWLMLCPERKRPDGSAEMPNQAEINVIANDCDRLDEIRTRLSDIRWFMRMVAEHVARRANDEEDMSGRFWQGRFRSVKLCDAAAILACM